MKTQRGVIAIRIRKRKASEKLLQNCVQLVKFFTSEGEIIGVENQLIKSI